MPLVDYDPRNIGPADDVAPSGPSKFIRPLPAKRDPGTGEIFLAAFRQGNIVGSMLSKVYNYWGADNSRVPGYDVWRDIVGTKYQTHLYQFAGSVNPSQTAAIKAQIDMEENDRDVLDNGGWLATAAKVTAGFADVTTFVPVGGPLARVAVGAYRLRRAAVTGEAAVRLAYGANIGSRTALRPAFGTRVVKAGIEGGVEGGVGAVVQEGVFQYSQELRTAHESMLGIGGGLVLGALIGSGVRAGLSQAERLASLRGYDALATRLRGDTPHPSPAFAPFLGTVRVGRVTPDAPPAPRPRSAIELSPAPTPTTIRLKPMDVAVGGSELRFSPGAAIRRATTLLGDDALRVAGSPVTAQARGTMRLEVSAGLAVLNREYSAMHAGGMRMSFDAFDRAVGRVVRTGGGSSNPHIVAASRALAQTLAAPLRGAVSGAAQGLKVGVARLPRRVRYDRARERVRDILQDTQAHYEKLLTGGSMRTFASQVPPSLLQRVGARLLRSGVLWKGVEFTSERSVDTTKQLAQDEIENSFKDDAPSDEGSAGSPMPQDSDALVTSTIARELAVEAVRRLLRGEAETETEKATEVRDRNDLKNPAVPDAVLESHDVLDDRASEFLRRGLRERAADDAIDAALGDGGMAALIERAATEYGLQRVAAESEATKAMLNRREVEELRRLQSARDLIRGDWRGSRNLGDTERLVNSTRHVDDVMERGRDIITHMTQLYRPAVIKALGATMHEGILPLVDHMRPHEVPVAEARVAAAAIGRGLMQRVAAISAFGDPIETGAPIERLMDVFSQPAGDWRAVTLWNQVLRAIPAIVAQDKILRGHLPVSERTQLGLSKSDLLAIKAQFAAHGEVVKGLAIPHSKLWTDSLAREQLDEAIELAAGLFEDEGSSFGSTPLGQLIRDFQSFLSAAHQRTALRNLDLPRARVAMAVTTMATLGMLVAVLEARGASGRSLSKLIANSRTHGHLIGAGLSRSGLFALGLDIAGLGDGNASVRIETSRPRIRFALPDIDPQRPSEAALQMMRTEAERALEREEDGLDPQDMNGPHTEMVPSPEMQAAAKLLPAGAFFGFRELLQAFAMASIDGAPEALGFEGEAQALQPGVQGPEGESRAAVIGINEEW